MHAITALLLHKPSIESPEQRKHSEAVDTFVDATCNIVSANELNKLHTKFSVALDVVKEFVPTSMKDLTLLVKDLEQAAAAATTTTTAEQPSAQQAAAAAAATLAVGARRSAIQQHPIRPRAVPFGASPLPRVVAAHHLRTWARRHHIDTCNVLGLSGADPHSADSTAGVEDYGEIFHELAC
jgi:hypothetical protein